VRQYSLKVDQERHQVSQAVVLLADARIATGTAASRTYESGPLEGQPLAENPHDHAAIWNGFQALADGKNPPAPLAGIADGEVKYRNTRSGSSSFES